MVLRLGGAWLLSFWKFTLALDDCQDATCSAQFLQVQAEARGRGSTGSPPSHPWPHFRGPNGGRRSGSTHENWTSHAGPTWTYHDPKGKYHNLLSGGAVIDKDLNLYQMSMKGLFALNSDGQVLWHYNTPGPVNNEATLSGELVLGTTKAGNAFAVNRRTGKEVWVTQLFYNAGGDCGYPAAHDGVFVVGAEDGHMKPMYGGNARVYGLDVKSGTKLWEYKPDITVWNFAPLFPGDGSTVFMDFAGGVYKLNLTTGAEQWKTLPESSRASYSDGGAGLGAGKVFTCSNFGANTGIEGSTGVVRAFHLSNGTEAWYKITTMPCNTYPTVGNIANVEPLAVVVAPGSFMMSPGVVTHGEVLALNAETGEQLWRHVVPPYEGIKGLGAGDFEGYSSRKAEGIGPYCIPAHWSAPLIDGEGLVVVGRSDGKLYKVYGPAAGYKGFRSHNMTVDSETGILAESIDMGSAFLHGAFAAAPGLFAVSSCDTLYVYKQ